MLPFARPILGCTLLLAAIFAGATPARAATASVGGATLTYTADGGESNALSVSLLASTYTLTDPGAVITAGAGCSPVTASQVTCSGATVTSLSIDLRDMADSVSQQATTASTISGGAANDLLVGGGAIDTLNGGADNDTLSGAVATTR